MDPKKIWLIISILISLSLRTHSATEDNSQEDEIISANYVLPKQIFNDGKPFYLDKDPISGQLDFSSKKPAGIEPEVNEVIDPKEKATVLNSVSPNFHDFLNLPVKYSSSKFVYPLVSSSYANLKYQGNNKNYMSNHKNYSTTMPTTSTPKYYTLHKLSSIKEKPTPTRMPVTSSTWRSVQTEKPTTRQKFVPTKKIIITERPLSKSSESSITRKPTKASTTTTTVAIKKKMTPEKTTSTTNTTANATTSSSTTTTTTTTTTKKRKTTARPSTQVVSTTKHIPTTPLSTTVKSTTTTSRPTTSTTISTRLTSVKPNKTTTAVTPKRTTPLKTTPLPVALKNTTTRPIEMPLITTPPPFLDVADIYNVVGNNKKEPNTMSLADLFSTLAEEESLSKPSNDGFDSQGNLMQPFSPARPAPFTLHQITKTSSSSKLPSTTMGTTTTTTESDFSSDISDQEANNYVRYEVQQPSVMQLQYHPAPSMNNIVISPGQHSASFVLGSQQAVGANNLIGTVEKEPVFQNGERIQYGTVINEDLASALRPQAQPINISGIQEFYTPTMSHTDKVIEGEHQMQDLTVSTTNVRFPSDNIGSGSVNIGRVPEIVNGHAQPVALPHMQANPLVFPPSENYNWQNTNKHEENIPASNVIFRDETYPDMEVSEKQDVLSLNQHNHHNQVSFPQLPEDLTPPHPPEEQSRPHLTSSPPHLYNEFTRKPLHGLHRPNSERPLPNILPQFRPNAKLSNGHPTHNKEPGNIRLHQKLPYPNRSLPPPFSHRRTPVGNRYNPKVNLDSIEANRRVYRVPSPHHPIDRIYMQQRFSQVHNRPPPPPPPVRYVDTFGMERHPMNANVYNLPSIDVKPERLPAFEEEDLMVEDPPKLIMEKEPEVPKAEPVVTLQMLKSHKKSQPDVVINNDSLQQAPKNSGQSPVYVVYPVKSSPLHMDVFESTDIEDPIVIGQRGEQPPQPPQSSQDKDVSSDYQNTPFSVIRDQPQEPILMAKNKSQTQSQSNRGNFPYPLEKPDPAFADFIEQIDGDRLNRDAIFDISPRVVNRGNTMNDDTHKNTDEPIAIAYTPTEPSKYYLDYQSYDKFSHPNLASPVIPEIRDTQTEATISEEFDSRGQYFEKDFMAPFYPSMSLSSVTNSPNGWSVYPGTTDGSVYEKNNINRADIGNPSKGDGDTTKKFDPDSFQPELQGGFKPIYPPDYKVKDSSEEDVHKPRISIESSSSTTITTTTTTTTEKPPERKKSKLQTSIESLLFGDDGDFEEEEQTEKSISGTSS